MWLYSIPKSVYGEIVMNKQAVDCLNTVHTVHEVHINSLRLNQH